MMDCECLVRVKERKEICIYFCLMICEPHEKSRKYLKLNPKNLLQYLIFLLTEQVLQALTTQKKNAETEWFALSSVEEKSHFFKVWDALVYTQISVKVESMWRDNYRKEKKMHLSRPLNSDIFAKDYVLGVHLHPKSLWIWSCSSLQIAIFMHKTCLI